jgi:biopolymer transport protein ExbD
MCKKSRVAAKKLAALFIAATSAACQLQTSQHSVAPVEALAPVGVRILGDGTIMIKDAPVSRDELAAQLAKLAAMTPPNRRCMSTPSLERPTAMSFM